jgi:hypothetical protein
MRRVAFYLVAVLATAWNCFALAQEVDVEILIGKSDPAMQAQIKAAVNVLLGRPLTPERITDWKAVRELQKLKELTDEEERIVEQLAIYAVTERREEDQQVLEALAVLHYLDLKPSLVIRVLAPYLDSENDNLRSFAGYWFTGHDNADAAPPRSPQLQPVNYDDYMKYVSRKLAHGEEVPAGFVTYIYERSPGRALLVFTYASGSPDAAAEFQAMRDVLEARKEGIEPEPRPELSREFKERRQARLRLKREMRLAEHIVSNAIWLKENEFAERFQAALPEAKEELANLAKHEEWWARLYVAYVMRQHPELRQPEIIRQLSQDSHALVSEAAAFD